MPDPEPNRKWFQFSLRLLLLVVVAGNVFWWTHRHVQSAHAEAEMWRERTEKTAQREAFIRTELIKIADDYFEEGIRSYEYAMAKTPERTGKELARLSAWRTRAHMSLVPASRLYKIEQGLNPEDSALVARLTDIEKRLIAMVNKFDMPK